jgi:hypothetical protein
LIFLTEGAAKYLRETYLPWRERFERMLGQKSDRLFPCEELTIYRWLKEARERAGLPWLEPRSAEEVQCSMDVRPRRRSHRY